MSTCPSPDLIHINRPVLESRNGHNHLQDININSLEDMLSYLNVYDIFISVSTLNKAIYHRVKQIKGSICRHKVLLILEHSQRCYDANTTQSYDWVNVLRSITSWPSDFDYLSIKSAIFDNIFSLSIPHDSTRPQIAYQGIRRGGNRCVVADCHFPALPLPISRDMRTFHKHKKIIRSNLPFIKTIQSSEQCDIIFSCVAYFEIQIGDPITPSIPEQLGSVDMVFASCVCIGICLSGFNVGSQMPGWRANSFGYHGDDGKLFHGSSEQSTIMDTFIQPSTFGPQDTVGCGLFYPPLGKYGRGGIFYTKNGVIVAELSFNHVGVLANAWYPVVGTDCHSPIQMNCGWKPFKFDVLSYEKTLLMKLPVKKEVIEDFHRTGLGVSSFINEDTVGYKYNARVTHPLVRNPWDYVRSLPHIQPLIHMNPSLLLSKMIASSRLSFLDVNLYGETREYNIDHPWYVESTHDTYGDYSPLFEPYENHNFADVYFLDEDDHWSEEEDEDSQYSDDMDMDDDDVDDCDEDEEDFILGGADETDFNDNMFDYHDIKCPCGGIGAEYDVDENAI